MQRNAKNRMAARATSVCAGSARQRGRLLAKSLRRLGSVILGLWAAASSAQGLTPQGIYPGDAAADAFKLPYEFEPVIRLRTFYKRTETLTETTQQAWALGGFAGLRSP